MKLIVCAVLTSVCALLPSRAVAQSPVLITAFNNPAPGAGDNFSWSLAAMGNDRVLIGAPFDDSYGTEAGAAFLFRTNGTLLATFINPEPAYNTDYGTYGFDRFGGSVAALGSDRVLVGSPRNRAEFLFSGTVFMFNTNGTLLMTITNEAPAGSEQFGTALAAFGANRFIVGAPYYHDLDIDEVVGIAYLFSSNGTKLAAFRNPDPFGIGNFGFVVKELGSDRVLIGSSMFDTNGTLLLTFPNPGSGGGFGYSVAAVGSDRVLIGAPFAGVGATNAGVAYLFSTNGNLLTTFTNPTPAVNDYFGYRVVAVGNDRVVISAPWDDTTKPDGGSAYLFRTDGTLIATLTKPNPAKDDLFGFPLASFGTDHVLIGAPYDNAPTRDSGSAYLFSIPPLPSLAIQRTTTNSVIVSWPTALTGYTLQQNTNGLGSVNWSNFTSAIQNDGTNKFIIVNPPVGNRFYRLLK